jgi:alpha-L-rhamnosidase
VDELSPVRFEHHREALGIGDPAPRLSWHVAAEHGWRQVAYELAIGDEVFRVASAESVLVPWPAAPLRPREARTVRVRVTGAGGCVSDWSDPATVERGLDAGDWQASLIEPPAAERGTAVLLRREFFADGAIAAGRLYATARGIYVAEINGRRVGDDALAPGWTSDRRLRCQAYDVTALLRPGANAIGFQVADGWRRGGPGLLAQLEITGGDGGRVVIGTDRAWRCATGPVLAADLGDGERYDATRERPGWSRPGFDDTGWDAGRIGDLGVAALVAPDGPAVRATGALAVRETITTPSGTTVLDFGQHLVGRLRIRVRGRRGATVTIRHAAALEDGELAVRPPQPALAADRYTLRGDRVRGAGGGEEWEPEFTVHRFRYAEVSGEHRDLTAVAVVYHADLPRTGWFGCSDDQLTRLHDNAAWSMRGNFVDGPAGCPQREEQVFAPAAYLYDCAGFLASWLKDHAPGRGDAAVTVPWVAYQRFGDHGLLRRQYPSMRAWADGPSASVIDPDLAATAYRAHVAGLLARTAAVLGEEADAARYAELAGSVRQAFLDEYASPHGQIVSDTPATHALALEFGLLPDAGQRARAAERLVRLVRASGQHAATGCLETPLICDALTSAGALDDAYRLLRRTQANNYAVADWMHRVIGGLAPAAPGYRELRVEPRPGGGLSWARTSHLTPYGLAEVSWRRERGMLTADIAVPAGSTATVVLPDSAPVHAGPGRHQFSGACRAAAEEA